MCVHPTAMYGIDAPHVVSYKTYIILFFLPFSRRRLPDRHLGDAQVKLFSHSYQKLLGSGPKLAVAHFHALSRLNGRSGLNGPYVQCTR